MAAKAGNTYSKGRPKGSKDKTNLETKKLITAFMGNKFTEVETAWASLRPLEKVQTYISLVKYVMPTLASVKVEDSNGDDVLKSFLASQK